MVRTLWQIIRGAYSQRRSGIDTADIEHLRADLRVRLALVEYAYFGRSGRRVARYAAELKSLLGEKAMHRYLRSLDPDLRTQFVERFQGARRDTAVEVAPGPGRGGRAESSTVTVTRARPTGKSASNVVPIDHAARKARPGSGPAGEPDQSTRQGRDPRSADTGE